ncbi:MAG TPA: hypothetical protein VLF19_04810 [Methylomirabilota bacterium]|nr:hypothetical protein [Methylomirabilota bacterium]
MVVLRWLLILVFSVVLDFVNPALPGALEFFEEAEEMVHRAGHHRIVRLPAASGHPARVGRPPTRVVRTTSRLVAPRRTFEPGSQARKAPPPGIADSPAAPEDH